MNYIISAKSEHESQRIKPHRQKDLVKLNRQSESAKVAKRRKHNHSGDEPQEERIWQTIGTASQDHS